MGLLTELAQDYFGFLAGHFPVMCASDEFHFLPRARDASRHYDLLDNLDTDAIDECIEGLRDFQAKLRGIAASEHKPEESLNIELIKNSMAGVLIEFEAARSYRRNPLLYLKIAFIGLDHALTKPASDLQEILERTAARLDAIPRLLLQATENLGVIPEAHHQAALMMLTDCRRFLAELAGNVTGLVPIREKARIISTGRLEKVAASLIGFENFLLGITPVSDRDICGPPVHITLADHFASTRTLSEVFEIAVEEWQENLQSVQKLRAQIDPGRSWVDLYHGYLPAEIHRLDTLDLYRRETASLRCFLDDHGFRGLTDMPLPEIEETPTYLQSVRSSASFAAAFTTDPRERDFFYITTRPRDRRSSVAGDLLTKRLHREYKFLCAHETFPGHLLLDFTRRTLDDPVRSQIESPLFYEGWAYYVESLLTECGYVDSPLDLLVDCKRRLWRAARCQIDSGFATGLIDGDRAMELLTATGFSREESQQQLDRFRLNPGYQLCYTLGRYELMRLRDMFGHKLGRDGFHREILQGGELPFHLVEKRLTRMCIEH